MPGVCESFRVHHVSIAGFVQVEMFPFTGRLCLLFVCVLLNMSSSFKQAFKRTGGRTCADAQASGNKAYT